MAKRTKKRQPAKTMALDVFENLAAQVVTGHGTWIALGYQLTGGCRLWRCKDGSWTGRFVYRSASKEPSMLTVSSVHVVRGIRIA